VDIGGRYILTSDPARPGGAADVYRAIDSAANPPCNVAVKILRTDAEDALVQKFFDREVGALRSLVHPNVVGLIDAGQTGEDRFLVLEWVEQDLLSFIGQERPDPVEFLTQVGAPVAEALAFAHERRLVHRDVKPANILMTAEGVPKLADFGISKLKTDLTSSPLTTAGFFSRPYAPPEKDTASSYSRDVFGFGVTMLRCLSGVTIDDYPDIDPALSDMADPEIRDLLASCVTFDTKARLRDAVLLEAQLQGLLRPRLHSDSAPLKVSLGLTRKARACLSEAGIETGDESFVKSDLLDSPSVDSPLDQLDLFEGRRVSVVGAEMRYSTVVDADHPSTLTVIHIRPLAPGEGDRQRDRVGSLGNVEFAVGEPLSTSQGTAAVRRLTELIDSRAAAAERALVDEDEERLFAEWAGQISARSDIEDQKERPLEYKAVSLEGRTAKFELEDEEAADIAIGEVRVVKPRHGRSRQTSTGEVMRVDGPIVSLFMQTPGDLPQMGLLAVDTRAGRVKIDRELQALDALRWGSAGVVRPDLKRVLVDPSKCSKPQQMNVARWFQTDLDLDKQEAVAAALGSEDVFVVQGPPGTGKTTFISELVSQALEADADAKVLISSQTNVALDNALEKIGALVPSHVRLLRLTSKREGEQSKVGRGAQPYLVETQLKGWRELVREESLAALETWCRTYGVEPEAVRCALALQETAELRLRVDRLSARIQEIAELLQGGATSSSSSDELAEELAEIRSLRLEAEEDASERIASLTWPGGVEGVRADADVQSLVRAADDLLVPAGDRAPLLRALVQLHTDWVTSLGRDRDFLEPLLRSAQVVGATCIGLPGYKPMKDISFDLCIVDEASKATATETLVPMVRARRWVLVGDDKQLPPFVEDSLRDPDLAAEYGFDALELRRTLFDRLWSDVPQECRRRLRTQHRMTHAVGDLISKCFYEGDLISEGPEPLQAIPRILPSPVTWLTTSGDDRRWESPAGPESKSYINRTEIKVVIGILRRLESTAAKRGCRFSVLVIAPYAAQVHQLHSRIATETSELLHLSIEVNTVDAVQGRQAQLVVFSVTRSNRARNFGFLNVDARANVALSRAEQGLIVVGDDEFCRSQEGPFKSILEHIGRNPRGCAIAPAVF
jgi:serine/threonine protein kinase